MVRSAWHGHTRCSGHHTYRHDRWFGLVHACHGSVQATCRVAHDAAAVCGGLGTNAARQQQAAKDALLHRKRPLCACRQRHLVCEPHGTLHLLVNTVVLPEHRAWQAAMLQACTSRLIHTQTYTMHTASLCVHWRRQEDLVRHSLSVRTPQTHLRAVQQRAGWLQPARRQLRQAWEQRRLVSSPLPPLAQVLGPSAPLEQLHREHNSSTKAVETPDVGTCLILDGSHSYVELSM